MPENGHSGDDIEKRAKELIAKIKEKDTERRKLAQTIPRILILGNHDDKSILYKIRDEIKNQGHYAFLLDELNPYLDDVAVGDCTKEEKCIEYASIILMIESDKSGVVSENMIIRNNPDHAQKTTLFVKDADFEDIVKINDERRMHHSKIIPYATIEDLIRKAVLWGVRECYRLADESIRGIN